MKIVDEMLAPYSIVIDSDNFTVGIEKEYERKDGEKYTQQVNQSFHSSIEGALKKIIKQKLNQEESIVNLFEYFNKFKELNDSFLSKFSSLEKLPKENIDADV